MVKKYCRVTNDQRKELVRLIHQESYTIKKAAKTTGVSYANAKAINQIFLNEKRTAKKTFRFRLKRIDAGR